MLDIKIETGIPVPKIPRARTGVTEALRQMQHGDSFVVCNQVQRNTAMICAAKIGVKVRTHRQADGSYRIWKL